MQPVRLTALLFGLGACAAPPAPAPTEPWQGEIASYLVNRGDRSEIEHRLRGEDGRLRPLIFSGPVELAPGSRVRVWGAAEGEAIRVRRHQVDEVPVAALPSALVMGQPKPTRRWAFVLVDVDGGGNPINKANAQDVLFSPDRLDSIRSYFREVSYGVQDLEGEVMGPIAYQMGGRCDTDRLAAALLPQIQGRFDQYLWFFGKQQPACDWAGIAELGRADRPTRHSWYNSFHSCTVLVQEPGHNFGMVHSSAMRCTQDGVPVPIAWPGQAGAQCRHIEYGNPFDPMGGGDCFHMNGVQKAYQDWLAGCNLVKATSSGTFTIYPLEHATDGPQVLQIPFPQPRSFSNAGRLTAYYLELRTPVGRDARVGQPQVQVLVANDVRDARYTGNNNWLLDMTPETMKLGDEALPVGKPFEDTLPGGPKFTVVSADASKAVIRVELGGQAAQGDQPGTGVCSDAKAYDPAAPVRSIAPATPPQMGSRDGGAAAGDAAVARDAGAPDARAGTGGAGGAGGRPANGGASGGGGGGDPGPEEEEPVTPPSRGASSSGGCRVGPGGPGGGAAVLLLLLALAVFRPSRSPLRRRA
jgi:hypothetical protein